MGRAGGEGRWGGPVGRGGGEGRWGGPVRRAGGEGRWGGKIGGSSLGIRYGQTSGSYPTSRDWNIYVAASSAAAIKSPEYRRISSA